MKTLRVLKLGSFLTTVSNHSLTEDQFKQHNFLKKRNAFNKCYINEAIEVLNNVRLVTEYGDIKCPTLLFSSNGQGQEQVWVLNRKNLQK